MLREKKAPGICDLQVVKEITGLPELFREAGRAQRRNNAHLDKSDNPAQSSLARAFFMRDFGLKSKRDSTLDINVKMES